MQSAKRVGERARVEVEASTVRTTPDTRHGANLSRGSLAQQQRARHGARTSRQLEGLDASAAPGSAPNRSGPRRASGIDEPVFSPAEPQHPRARCHVGPGHAIRCPHHLAGPAVEEGPRGVNVDHRDPSRGIRGTAPVLQVVVEDIRERVESLARGAELAIVIAICPKATGALKNAIHLTGERDDEPT